MRIVIDHELDQHGNRIAEHVIHTERADWNYVKDPLDETKHIDMIDWLAKVNADPALRAKAGYDEQSQLVGELAPKSRWQRLVDASKHPLAPKELKDLALK